MLKRFGSVVVVGVVLSLLVGCSAFSRGPGDTVKAFYGAAEKGDTKAATEMMSAQTAAQLGGKAEQVVAMLGSQIKAKGGISSMEVEEETITGETAHVKILIRFGNGAEDHEDGELVREDGHWKLSK